MGTNVRAMPTGPFQDFVRTGCTPNVIREYIREVLSPDLVKRGFEMAMGNTLHTVPVAVPGAKDHPPHIEFVDLPAPPAVQASLIGKLLITGVPALKPQEHDGGERIPAVFVLPPLEGLDEARRIAQQRRIAAHGMDPNVPLGGGYIPPPGLEVVLVEENFATTGTPPPRTAKVAPVAPSPRPTKAQEIAAKRRARSAKPTPKSKR